MELMGLDLPGIDIVGGGLNRMETLALHSRIWSLPREYPQMFPTLGELFGFLHFPLYVERSSPVVEAPCIWNSQRLWRSFQFLQSPTAIHTLTAICPNSSNFNWSWPTFHFHTKRVGNKTVFTQMEFTLIALLNTGLYFSSNSVYQWGIILPFSWK